MPIAIESVKVGPPPPSQPDIQIVPAGEPERPESEAPVVIEASDLVPSASVAPPAADSPPPLPVPAVAPAPPVPVIEGPPSSVEKVARLASARPPAPEPFSSSAADGESINQSLDRLVAREGPRTAEVSRAFDDRPDTLTEPRELFGRLAANHVRPVRELLIDLRWGEAARDSFISAGAAVASLRKAAEQLGLAELVAALDGFGAAITAADGQGAGAGALHGAARARVISAYDDLARALPTAFALEDERAQRESVIVESVMLQVSGVHRVTLERVVAAGLASIGLLADARPAELADAAGIPMDVAKRIVTAFHAFREQRLAAPPDAARSNERARLRQLSSQLAEENDAFERASSTWTAEATEQKKQMRRAREKTLMEISAVLARLGEVALLERLEKMPFDMKLDGLRTFLKETRGPGAAAH